jgi:hypothetical protein
MTSSAARDAPDARANALVVSAVPSDLDVVRSLTV